MSDFPYPSRFHLPVIHTFSRETSLGATGGGGPFGVRGSLASAVWPVANTAFYVPFSIDAPYLVKTVFWANGAAVAGNVDVGVYTADMAALLFNAGSTVQATTGVPQAVALGTPVLLEPGSYQMAMSASSHSAAFLAASNSAAGATPLQALGCSNQAAAGVPLPAAATPATPTFVSYAPLFGFSSRVSTLI